MLLTTGIQKWQNEQNDSGIQGIKGIILKMLQIVPCVMADLSRQFDGNLLFHFTVMLLPDTPRRLDGRPWNSLGMDETV